MMYGLLNISYCSWKVSTSSLYIFPIKHSGQFHQIRCCSSLRHIYSSQLTSWTYPSKYQVCIANAGHIILLISYQIYTSAGLKEKLHSCVDNKKTMWVQPSVCLVVHSAWVVIFYGHLIIVFYIMVNTFLNLAEIQ